MEMKKSKILFVHLLNDYSGSPLILSTVIKGLIKKGFHCELISCADSEGFLSNIDQLNYHFFQYRWHKNKYARLVLFLWSQLVLFFKVLQNSDSNTSLYINTVLPFGAALAGKLKGLKIIYHIHEVSVKPEILKKFLFLIVNLTSGKNIFVSKFLQESGKKLRAEGATVHNALSEQFIRKAKQQLNFTKPESPFTALMLCSLKDYKGVKEFVEIAKQCDHIQFELVINAAQADIDQYFHLIDSPENLKIYDRQSNVHPFFHRAHLILNLSHPEQWVETFGMTLLEGMFYGLPGIAPPVGGPKEIIDHQKNGFLIDQRNKEDLVNCIRKLQSDPNYYNSISKMAKLKSLEFNQARMISQIHKMLKTGPE